MKEPNFFSRHYDRGMAYYEQFFPPRSPDRIRMDASTSYTFPHFPEALPRLAKASPDALVVYVVRDPLERAYSHYRHNRHYFEVEKAETFGAGLRASPVFLGASDFEHWLGKLHELFGSERVLAVPFDMLTTDIAEVATVICDRLGLESEWSQDASSKAEAYQNNVVTFRNSFFRTISDRVRQSSIYGPIRRAIGPQRIRRLRDLMTKQVTPPTLDEALGTCDPEQLDEVHALADRARRAVTAKLSAQDELLGLNWANR